MKRKKLNVEKIWKQTEDLLVPNLQITPLERAVYCHLLRHSRMEGIRRLKLSIIKLGKGIQVSCEPARTALRRLAAKGVVRIHERNKQGHIVEVLLPSEISLCRRESAACEVPDVETTDFLSTKELREAIHRREDFRCFYCYRFLNERTRALDHVVPKVKNGRNSYRNLVSCCTECNSLKGERPVEDFVRQLFRDSRLSVTEMDERLRAIQALKDGKLKPWFYAKEPKAGRMRRRRRACAPQFEVSAASSGRP